MMMYVLQSYILNKSVIVMERNEFNIPRYNADISMNEHVKYGC